MTRTRLISFTGVMIIASVVFAVSQGSDNRNALLSQLRSNNWQERAAAAEKLIVDRDALRSDQVKIALIDLLERENQVIESTLRESNGQEGVSVKYGEGFSEYYSALLGAVDQVADSSDKRTLDGLTRSAYNPDSQFALKLASYGSAVVPTLLELANSDVGPRRASAVALLSQILKRDKMRTDHMSTDIYQQVKGVLVRGLGDDDVGVRIQAARGLGEVGDKDAIPLLERLAQNDPASAPAAERGKKKFPVRDEAFKALSAIKANDANR